MKLQINVTKDIIIKSQFCDEDVPFNCAVSLAIRDIFPKAGVSPLFIVPFVEGKSDFPTAIKEQDKSNLIVLPINAVVFISKFDRSTPRQRLSLEPMSFEIDIPDEVIERINIDEVKGVLKDHPTMQLV